MKDWQERVIEEAAELDKKGAALAAFLYDSDKYETLDRVERIELAIQFGAMTAYSAALIDRIGRFEN